MESAPVRFWLATFETDITAQASGPAAGPLLASAPAGATGKRAFAMEVLSRGTEFAVAISTVDDSERPTKLTCCLGFANAVWACDRAREWGFPVVEARISYAEVGGVLTVTAPFFAAATEAESEVIRYEEPLFSVGSVAFNEAIGSDVSLDLSYVQSIAVPDSARPDVEVATVPALLQTVRSDVVRWQPHDVALWVSSARYPTLAPLQSETITSARLWSGSISGTRCRRTPPLKLQHRVDTVATLAYRFEDVEILGFRIDLSEYAGEADRILESLVAPLNFHRDAMGSTFRPVGTAGLADFRYGAATRTLVIELLRYGKMKLDRAMPPLEPDDYQSQHELLLRVLVGRLDDDTAQARDPAVFVPAIFVDNPWSKTIGRELQGFDKRLASFWVMSDGRYRPLRPDGCFRGETKHAVPQPLGNVCQVRLDSVVGEVSSDTIFELDCGAATLAGEDAFTAVDPRLALGRWRFAGVRWRQTDFAAREFRRSFARPVAADGISGLRSVQVAPVDERGLAQTWIQSAFLLDDIRLAFPSGIAALTLRSPPAAPQPWKDLCELLEGSGTARVSLPTGDWYRLKCSMRLRVEDSLAW